MNRKSGFALAFCLITSVLMPVSVLGQGNSQSEILERLQRLEEQQAQFSEQLREKDDRIRELEKQLAETSVSPEAVSAGSVNAVAEAQAETPVATSTTEEYFGEFQPGGRGFKLADTSWGDVNFSAWAYARYLNQSGLDDTYTDAFGRTRELDLRQDIQLNKVNVYFKGWVYDPRLRYLFYAWTSNTSQGEGAQVVVAGNLAYRFNEMAELGVGIGALPGTRTLRGTFPYWNKVDNRPIADEFFRPSYTSGVWAGGKFSDTVNYRVMLGNNLSQLGVSAAELDEGLNTFSAAVWWTPSTGEYGPSGGYGDFDYHEDMATTFGAHFTRSREDRQSQPGTEDIQNTQLRLSDGTVIFQPDAFGTGGSISRATYQMTSVDAGLKYRGFALEGEYYFRWLDDFEFEGAIPLSELFDHGFQVQASMMLLPRKLQSYLAGSKIFGEYGDPWDIALGLNWYPLEQQLFRVNTELLYLYNSPVGYSSVPFQLGGNGTVFNANIEVVF